MWLWGQVRDEERWGEAKDSWAPWFSGGVPRVPVLPPLASPPALLAPGMAPQPPVALAWHVM